MTTLPKVLTRRTQTPDGGPPLGLDPGQLAVEMGEPARLWVGVPVAADPSGRKLLSSSVVTATAAPSFPMPGMLWWNPTTRIMAVYYDLGSGLAWQQVTSPPGTYVQKAGDTMTGNLIINRPDPILILNDTGVNTATLAYLRNSLTRWRAGIENQDTGGNVGSDYTIRRADDAGNPIDMALQINRQTGKVTIFHELQVNAALTLLNANPFYLYYGGSANYAAINSNGGGGIDILTGTAGVSIRGTVRNDGALIYNSDSVYKPTAGSWLAISDARIKNVTGDYAAGLEQVLALKPVRYRLKGNVSLSSAVESGKTPNPEFDEANPKLGVDEFMPPDTAAPYSHSPHYATAVSEKECIGFVAQDVEAVMPEMVTQGEGYIDLQKVYDLRTLDTGPLIFALVNAVKELSAKVAVLETAALARK